MKVARIFTDGKGESHFDDVDMPLEETNFIEGAQPIRVTEPWSAKSVSIASIPPGWADPEHPTPVRQIVVFLSGVAEFTASDGEARVFQKGDVVMFEDVSGAGHGTRFLSDTESLLVLIKLAQDPA